MNYRTIEEVSLEVVSCRRCKRLVSYRESLPARASYSLEEYWRRPVAGFFTGDESGRFLLSSLHEAGYSNQPTSESRGDGLVLFDCYITAAVKCAPPQNRPTREEFENCSSYLEAELSLMVRAESVLTLGGQAFSSFLRHVGKNGGRVRGLKFTHGGRYEIPGFPTLYASYHPSPRNTYTGKLTKRMLVALLQRIRRSNESGKRLREVRAR